MLIDSRLKPELCCRKADKPGKTDEPVKHHPYEHVYILPELPGVTPREVGEGERPGVAFASDGRMAVVVPVTLAAERDIDSGMLPDVLGPIIPDALAHARKNPVAEKTASLELRDETVTPDLAAFPRRLPGVEFEDTAKITPALMLSSLLTEGAPVTWISLNPFRLVEIAKAMGLRAGDGVTLLFRGDAGAISVLPLTSSACFPGEALGVLMPMARPDDLAKKDGEVLP